MKNIRIVIGVILGLLLVVLYEISLNEINNTHREKELFSLTSLFQARLETSLKESLNTLEHLTTLCLLDSDLSQQDFEEYSRNQIQSHFKYIQLQYADARFDTIYTYVHKPLWADVVSEKKKVIVLDYGGIEMRRAIELQKIALQGPIKLLPDKYGVVFWSPVFQGDMFLGIVTGVFLLEDLFLPILDDDIFGNVDVSVIDGSDMLIWGRSKQFTNVETTAISIADRSWYISLGWKKNTSVIPLETRLIILTSGVFFICALVYVFFLNTKVTQRLEREVDRLTANLESLEDKDKEEKSAIAETEMALRKSEERYRALFDNNPIQTIVVDNTCRIVMYNFAGKRSRDRKPVIGTLMYKDYAEHHQIDMFSELMKCIENGQQKEFPELKYKERYLHIHISPFSDGAIITSIDITAAKKLFDQLQHSHKMEAVGTLAGGIAHEFNNILGIIVGNVELAVDEIDDKKVCSECLVEIRTATMRAKDVVRQLLSFSRQKNRKKGPLKISELLEDSVSNLIRPSIPSSIDIFSSIKKNVSMIMADPLQIQQILINLCNNSAQAMDKEKGEIHIELKEILLQYEREEIYKHIRPGNYVQLTVKDNAKGIEKEIQDKIFNPYFTTKEVGQGTGMGLAIVHGIVTDHGAEIVFSSSEETGTVMHVLFPPLIGHTSI